MGTLLSVKKSISYVLIASAILVAPPTTISREFSALFQVRGELIQNTAKTLPHRSKVTRSAFVRSREPPAK
jgi:hypothetical protein